VKLLVTQYRYGVFSTAARGFSGWTPSAEISWNNGNPMNTCAAVTPFLGTFMVTVGP
jgi:hypothetical protein